MEEMPKIKEVKEDMNLFVFNNFNLSLDDYKYINDSMEETIKKIKELRYEDTKNEI